MQTRTTIFLFKVYNILNICKKGKTAKTYDDELDGDISKECKNVDVVVILLTCYL